MIQGELGSVRDSLPYIRTYTGKKFYHGCPLPEDVDIMDIAHALSQICRFTGHTKEFYSVAEHCVRGSYKCTEPLKFLLHDASEAYYSDLNRPLKYLPKMEAYVNYERQGQEIIAEHFGLEPGCLECPEVKLVDNRMLSTELRDLMHGIKPDFPSFEPYDDLDLKGKTWNPNSAKYAYLARFYELTEGNTNKASLGW